ncbi:MAG: type II toxin-antitoxin system HicB family antitoxin [Desulfohalobiaceae bacterium]|nr:type II toxin-antitoxin system HicB family antitoxin [Desulfohalobiaceae bacterium]
MQNVLEYKGYYGSVEYDSRDDQLHGRLIGISDIISYEGQSVNELKQDFQEAVEDYLETCREAGKEPEKPFSGKFIVRMPRELHAAVSMKAKEHGESLNTWIVETLSRSVGQAQ